MNRLLNAANDYIKGCDWKDMSLLKICLCAMGVLVGLAIPGRRKKAAAWIASAAFVLTYIPLMMKFLPFLTRAGIRDIYED